MQTYTYDYKTRMRNQVKCLTQHVKGTIEKRRAKQ